jgi:hypothetical protein
MLVNGMEFHTECIWKFCVLQTFHFCSICCLVLLTFPSQNFMSSATNFLMGYNVQQRSQITFQKILNYSSLLKNSIKYWISFQHLSLWDCIYLGFVKHLLRSLSWSDDAAFSQGTFYFYLKTANWNQTNIHYGYDRITWTNEDLHKYLHILSPISVKKYLRFEYNCGISTWHKLNHTGNKSPRK